ncbi:DUF2750 domain-containing protein [Hyphomicrobium sp.]|uniref:DUF2750 domain-containing protein n=1 Tax=Hyphomicrobium sp. TaxID=82 RepID=UPI002D7676DD|nr:DUF2750 domain-containing protein [Hyphomicrobium sp.]HET6390617.1 DUF2750 domain-containing protein [Hyphomicrobium sp.]
MLNAPRIPELAQRDRFVRRAVAEGRVLTLADEENASVPSQKVSGRTVQLFWSSPLEAERWAEALAGNTDLQDISLEVFATDILPGIATAKGLVGTDWVSDPIEAEIDPRDLLIRLKTEAIPAYAAAIRAKGEVYLVGGSGGPMLTPGTQKPRSADRLHVFSSRSDAEAHMKKLSGKLIITDPIAAFVGSRLPWAAEHGHAVMIEPIRGAGFVEVKTANLAAHLSKEVADAP